MDVSGPTQPKCSRPAHSKPVLDEPCGLPVLLLDCDDPPGTPGHISRFDIDRSEEQL